MKIAFSNWRLDIFAHKEAWILELIILGSALLLLYGLGHYIARVIEKKASKDEEDWRSHMHHVVHLPLLFLIALLGISFSVDIVGERFFPNVDLEDYDAFRNASVIAILAWFFLRWKSTVQKTLLSKAYVKRKGVDRTATLVVGRLISILILIITCITMLQIIGLDIGPLLAFSGIGAASVGFAAKDVIANFFGGLMLYMNRSFTIGDFVYIPEKSIEGHVEEIGWYTTAIRDKDRRPMYLPNALFSTAIVINGSRMTHRRVLETVNISYNDVEKVITITEAIRRALKEHPEVDPSAPMNIYFGKFAEYAVTISLEFYVNTTQWEAFHRVKEELLVLIYELIRKNGATIPFPTSLMKMEKEN